MIFKNSHLIKRTDIHKYAYCHNGYKWTICDIAYISKSKQSVKFVIKDWKKVTCPFCLQAKEKIKQRIIKSLKNLD